jgi:hypothetical protein
MNAATTEQHKHNEKTTDSYFSQNIMKITRKKFDMKNTHIIQGPYNKQ